jgi:ABC-type bacteriocin/lantibiotic exporter with double-glycine peptidase domain
VGSSAGTPDLSRPLRRAAIPGREVLGFGLRGCGVVLLWLVLMGAAGGLLAMVVPIASGLIFDSFIPRAEQDQLVQLAQVLVAAALFQVGRGIAVLRLETRIDASLQATRIAIAHRLSTIQHADRIFVLQGGRIVQRGTYAELARRSWRGTAVRSAI